jgi:membrane protease YdiL (CAAX protease family)
MTLTMFGHILFGGTVPGYVPFGVRWTFIAFNFVLIFIIGGPIGKEFGWQGFVLLTLETKFSAPRVSLMLGIIWTVWHLPLFLI